MNKLHRTLITAGITAALLSPTLAQEPGQTPTQSAAGAPVALTLKRAVELALQNSKDIQAAKLQARLADNSAQITKAQFLPSVSAGSGAGYTYGIPETPGGRAPALFNVTYTEQVYNEPLRGQAKEFRLVGEKRGYYPSVELVSVYSLLAKFNNYDQFFRTFQRNNYNAGVQVQVPLFSAQTKANIGLAAVNLDVAKANLANKKTEITASVRQKTRHLRERDAAKEVARLELQLAQQDVTVLQSQFEEGKINLREVERARLIESEKWMVYLDANFQRQQAQLDLLQTAGQLDKVWQ